MMPTNPICPEGYGPDLLFRFPFEPFFAEPSYGQDCGLSYLGFNIYGGIVFACTFIYLLVHLMTLSEAESLLFTLVRVVHIVTLSLILAVYILMWVEPTRAYIINGIATSVFMATAGFVWTALGYQTVIKTLVNVQMKKDVNIVRCSQLQCVSYCYRTNIQLVVPYAQYTMLGGKVLTSLCFALLLGSNLGLQCSVYATIIYLSQGNVPMAALMYRLHAAFIALGAVSFLIPTTLALTRFINMIEASIKSSLHDTNSSYVTQLKDVEARFRSLRRIFFVCASSAAFLFILHATILPLLWWIQVTHMHTTAFCCFYLLFAITAPRKRARVVRLFSCGFVQLHQQADAKATDADGMDVEELAKPATPMSMRPPAM